MSGNDAGAILHWVAAAGESGATVADLARRLGSAHSPVLDVLEQAARAGSLRLAKGSVAGQDRWIAAAVFERVARRAPAILEEFFRRDRLATGMPKAEVVRRLLPAPAAPLAEVYLGWLAERKILAVGADLVNPPGRGAAMSAEESELAERVMAAFERGGLSPPAPTEIAQALGATQRTFDAVLRYLYQRKQVARVGQGLFIAQSQLDRLADELAKTGWSQFSVPDFKDRFGLTRKWAIPLLEHLDADRTHAPQGRPARGGEEVSDAARGAGSREPTALQAIGRGLRRRCPRCGEGPIFEGFINVRKQCTSCGFVFEERSGDTWGFWVLLDRVFLVIPVVLILLGFATSSLRLRLLLIGLLLIPLIATMPHRQGVAIALDYLFRRRQQRSVLRSRS